MAHFAHINDQKQVDMVIVVANDDCGGGDFPESEPIGQAFIASLGLDGTWLQTSYSNQFRNKYAATYDLFDESVEPYGAFVEPVWPDEN